MSSRIPYRLCHAHAAVVLCGLAVYLLSGLLGGCGERDDYIVGVLDQQPAEVVDEGSYEVYTPPGTWFYGWLELAAWSNGDMLQANSNNSVFLVRGDRYFPTDWPRDYSIIGLICLDDGSAWAADELGGVGFYDGSNWEIVANLAGTGYSGMLLDHEARPVVFGRDGLVRRYESGAWLDIAPDTDADILAGWAAADHGLYLVDRDLTLYHEQDGSWLQSTPFTGFEPDVGSVFLDGDDQGHLVCGVLGYGDFWIYDGEAWQHCLPDGGSMAENLYKDLFWQQGEVFALLPYRSGFHSWDGGQWEYCCSLPESYGGFEYSVPVDSGRLVVTDWDAVFRLELAELTVVQPPLGRLRGVVEFQGAIHCLMSRGSLLVQDGDGWRWLDRPVAETPYLESASCLQIASPTELLIIGADQILLWRPDGSETVVVGGRYQHIWPQASGDLLVGEDLRIGRIDSDGLVWEADLPLDWSHVDNVVEDIDGGFWLRDSSRVGYWRDGDVETRMLLTGDWVDGLLYDPQRGVVIYGWEKLLLLGADGYRDLTPHLGTGYTSRACRFDRMCLDSLGRWIGWERNSLDILRYDGDRWIRLVPGDHIEFGTLGTGTHMAPVENGDLWLWYGTNIVYFHAGEGP